MSSSLLLPGLRRVALRPPFAPIACRQCLRQQTQQPSMRPSRILRIVRQASTQAQPATTTLNSVSTKASAAKPAWPETNSKAVGYWLLGSAASVFGIVVFGGLTRLTESGLSITEWKPVTGSLWPQSQSHWESEFEKYRASPEFKMLNSHMDLADGPTGSGGRVIGMSFVLPTIYFIARRRVTKRMALNLVGISALIGFQGAIGWWMVASGLKDDLFAPGSHPRVSQYRLTTHLATAFVCYSWMLLAGLGALRARRLVADPAAAAKVMDALKNPALVPFRRSVTALTALVFVTVLSGALVAGLDAGLIYNEFPKMGLGLTPPKSELWDKFYSRKEDGSDLWWRNMLENPSLVQLDHRILATTTFCAVLALFAYSRTGRVAAALPKDAKKGVLGVVHLASLQVALGISTLIYMVPISLAAAHQAGALALLTGALIVGQRLRVPRSVIASAQRKLKSTTR
ncbi:cytochrome c oxidase assembly protein cox15 [Apiospora phragmitis]|uniref:Cytochrome c oxidase assembly protein cox15 n=1 Tax=Apiospora phragmitis TaxID=2905665 RepID=A0ABR1SU81_9PEZI